MNYLKVCLVGILVMALPSLGSGGAPASPSIEALKAKLSSAPSAEREKIIKAFIKENEGRFPLIEDSLVTFVYYGKVGLRVTVPSDLNKWDVKADVMERIEGTDFYYLTLKLPLDARIDYKFYVDNMWMLDPLNSKTVLGGFGPNSAFSMPKYIPPKEIEYIDSIPHGRIEEHDFESQVMKNKRKVRIYLPPGYDPHSSKKYPVVFVQDGGEYIKLASMVNVLDNIIFEAKIPPVIAVFIDPVDRNYEYYANNDYEKMLVEEIVPFVRAGYAVSDAPEWSAVMGVSLGGTISLMVAIDHPGVFGNCGSQSGAFGIDNDRLFSLVESQPHKPVKFYLDCGRFGDLTDDNRRMRALLLERGYEVKYQEFNEGHSWGNWRAHIDDILIFFWGEPNH